MQLAREVGHVARNGGLDFASLSDYTNTTSQIAHSGHDVEDFLDFGAKERPRLDRPRHTTKNACVVVADRLSVVNHIVSEQGHKIIHHVVKAKTKLQILD